MTRQDHLTQLLGALTPADPLEADYLARMRQILATTAAPFSRDQFEPGHFTASAFVQSPDRGSILLIEHAKLGRWLQPGGHVEPDDPNVLAAARREVSEEVGLADLPSALGEALLDVDIHEIPARKSDPAHLHLDVRFLLQAPTREVRAGSDAKAARWVLLSEVHREATDESVLRAVRKIRAAAP